MIDADINRRSAWTRHLLVAAGLLVAVGAVYAQVHDFEFINYDDDRYVYENVAVTGGLTPGGVKWALTRSHLGFWMPVTWMSHMLDYQVFGLNAGAHHLTSVTVHAFNALLLYLLLWRLTSAVGRSALVAALFALHPIAVDPVAWVAERKELLCVFFGLCALHAYVHYVARPRAGWYLLSLALFALGLMSKPMLVTLPLLILLLDCWPLDRIRPDQVAGWHRPRWWRVDGKWTAPAWIVAEKIPFLALAAGLALLTVIAYGSSDGLVTLAERGVLFRVANALTSYATYLVTLAWPAKLAITYPFPRGGWPNWQVMASGFSVTVLTFWALGKLRVRPQITIGWFWYLVSLLPVIGLVQQGVQARADHYMYLPQIGIYVAVVWTVADLAAQRRVPSALPFLVSMALIVAAAVVSFVQVGTWRNRTTVFTQAIAVTDDNVAAHLQLGTAQAQQKMYQEAEKNFARAVELNPGYGLAQSNLGFAMYHQGRFREAVACFRKALQIDPGDAVSRQGLERALDRAGAVR
ncbi:MAG: hypothetical protein CMJ18_10055 [Phycisphaeraceae bacterium]|nr:hypothetical protein [Phycisphaeraceae bacterium]